MLDITFDISTVDEMLAKDVPESVVMTVVKAIMLEKDVDEIIISEHR